MSISTILKDLRIENGIYQKELAAYLNVSIGTISNYEQGVHDPNLDTLVKIAKFYGVTTDYLLGLTTYPYRPDALSKSITDSYSMARFFRLLANSSVQDKNFLAYVFRLLEIKHSKATPSSSMPEQKHQ